jgi:hypothetical protein
VRSRATLAVAGVLAGALLASSGACSGTQRGAGTTLFRDVPPPPSAAGRRDVAVKRARFVDIDVAALRQPSNRVDLFPGGPPGPVTVVWSRIEQPSAQSQAWIGHPSEGEHAGSVTLVVNQAERVVAGTIHLAGALYRIRYAGHGVHAIEELSSREFPKD